jgi:prephenate dehydrogenase
VDAAYRDPADAVRDADLVVLATPLFAMAEVLGEAAPALRRGALVTDVGSVKASVTALLPGFLPRGVSYVGAHPMAGSHQQGIAHARADLFEGAACIVTPTPGADGSAVTRACEFWSGLGARVVVRDPERHDTEVAWVSHLPHAVAFAFARALESAPREGADVTGAGFADFTRIAHGAPELWAEILTANRKALAGPLQEVAERLQALARQVEAGDVDAVERFIAEARASLLRLGASPQSSSRARSGGRNPGVPIAEDGGRERSNKHLT